MKIFAETVIDNGDKNIYCYDEKNGVLRAVVSVDKHDENNKEVMYVNSVKTTGVDTSVLKLPKGAIDITDFHISMD